MVWVDFQVEFVCFLGAETQFGQNGSSPTGPHIPSPTSSGSPSQASWGQWRQGGQASLDGKGVFRGQVSVGQSHSRHGIHGVGVGS